MLVTFLMEMRESLDYPNFKMFSGMDLGVF